LYRTSPQSTSGNPGVQPGDTCDRGLAAGVALHQAARVRREDNVESDEIVIVLTTVGADVNAGQMASTLVEEHLAACVNVLPEMTSYFRWRGVVEQAEERQLVIKTTAAQLPALEQRLLDVHPYEVPEFLVVPIEAASDAYFKWVLGAIGATPDDGEIKH
jgi:periplasmic divalent cation tolerance protein